MRTMQGVVAAHKPWDLKRGVRGIRRCLQAAFGGCSGVRTKSEHILEAAMEARAHLSDTIEILWHLIG